MRIAYAYKLVMAGILLGSAAANLRAAEEGKKTVRYTFGPAAKPRPGDVRRVKSRYTCTSETLILENSAETVTDIDTLTRAFTRRETLLTPDLPESAESAQAPAERALVAGWTLAFEAWKVERARNGKPAPPLKQNLAGQAYTLRHDPARKKIFLTDAAGQHVRGPVLLEVARGTRPLVQAAQFDRAAAALAGKTFEAGQRVPLEKPLLLALTDIEPENLGAVEDFTAVYLETTPGPQPLAAVLIKARAFLKERGFAGMTKWEGALTFDAGGRVRSAVVKTETRRAAIPPGGLAPQAGEALKKEVTRTREEVEWYFDAVNAPAGAADK